MSSYYGGGWATDEVEVESLGGNEGVEDPRRARFGLRVVCSGEAHLRLRGYELVKVIIMLSSLVRLQMLLGLMGWVVR